MSKEKDLWEKTCYYLAVEVANHYKLETVRQLQLSGKSWEKLASHFAILFSDKNTKQVIIVTVYYQNTLYTCTYVAVHNSTRCSKVEKRSS